MQFLRVICVLATIVVATAQRDCSGSAGNTAFDTWCDASCNNDPPHCPPNLCTCVGDPVVEPCFGVGIFEGLLDGWCTESCYAASPNCPESFCRCGPVDVGTIVEINPHEPTCCAEDDTYVFFADGPKIMRKVNDQDPEICYDFAGGQPSSLVVDDSGNLYVADRVSSSVSRMSVNCNMTSVKILTSWVLGGPVDKPTGIAIVPGQGLLISALRGAWEMRFDSNGDVFSLERIADFENDHIRDIEVVGRMVYYVFRDAMVLVLDLDTGLTTTFLNPGQHNIVDYGGITINQCGMFFTATDNNRVYFCPDLNDNSTCTLYCVPDASIDDYTCVNTNNPIGIATGCCCDIYVTNPGNGCLTYFRNDGRNPLTLANPRVPEIVMCNLTHPQAVVVYQPPRIGLCTDVCLGPPSSLFCAKSSNGPDSTIAFPGDTISVDVRVSEETTTPDVECGGIPLTVSASQAIVGSDGESGMTGAMTPSASDDVSVTACVNNPNAAQANNVISNSDNGNACFSFTTANSVWTMAFGGNGGATVSTVQATTPCATNDGADHSVAVTVGNGVVTFYLDGDMCGEPVPVPGGANPLSFCDGAGTSTLVGAPGASIKNVIVHDVELLASDVTNFQCSDAVVETNTIFIARRVVDANEPIGEVVCTVTNYEASGGRIGDPGVQDPDAQCRVEVRAPTTSPSASPSTSASPSPSPSVTATPSPTPSSSGSASPSASPSPSESATPSPTPSSSESAPPSPTPSPSESAIPSPTPSPSETAPPSPTPSPSESAPPSPTPSPTTTAPQTASPSPSVSATPSSSASPSETATPSPTPSPSETGTPSPSPSPSSSASPSPSSSPSASPSPSPSPSPSSSPSASPSPSSSPSPSPSASSSPSPSPSASPSPSPSSSPSSSPSASQSASASQSSSASETASPSPTPSSSPSTSPTSTPSPSPSPTPSITRRVARLVPGVNLQASGGITQSALLVGTASVSLIICDPGQPKFLCFPKLDRSNEYLVPINKLDAVNQPGDPERTERFPVFLQAIAKRGNNFLSVHEPFRRLCIFHGTPILRQGGSEVDCSAVSCFFNPANGAVRNVNDCPTTLSANSVTAARDRTRQGIQDSIDFLEAASPGSTNGFNPFLPANVPANLFQDATTNMCENDMFGEFSVSLTSLRASAPVTITIMTQPRFDFASRCAIRDPVTDMAERTCYSAGPFPNSIFTENGEPIIFGDDTGRTCVDEFLVGDNNEPVITTSLDPLDTPFLPEIQPSDFKAVDPVLQILYGDIVDTGFSASVRSSGCPANWPAVLCAQSTSRKCYVDECI